MTASNTAAIKPPDGGWGWVIVAATFFIFFLSFGTTYSIEIVFDILMQEFDCSKSEVSIIASIAFSLPCFLGPFVSFLEQRYKTRAVVLAGCILVSIAFISSAFAPTLFTLYFTFGLLAGVGLALAYLPTLVMISVYFNHHRTLATAIGCVGSYVGCFAHPYLMRYLTSVYGWRGTLLITGAIALNSVAATFFLRTLEDTNKVQPSTSSQPPSPKSDSTTAHSEAGDPLVSFSISESPECDRQEAQIADDELVDWPTITSTNSSGWPSKIIAARKENIYRGRPRSATPRPAADGQQRISAPSSLLFLNRERAKLESVKEQLFDGFDGYYGVMSLPATPICDIERADFGQTSSLTASSRPHMSSLSSVYSSTLVSLPSDESVCKAPPPSLSPSFIIAKIEETPEEELELPSCSAVIPEDDKTGEESSTSNAQEGSCIPLILEPLFGHFRNPEFSSFVLSNFLSCLSFYIPTMFVVDWGNRLGIESSQTTLLLSLIGVGHVIGRPLLALLGDVFADHRIPLYSLMVGLAGIGTAITPLYPNFATLAVFVFQFAFFMGGSQTLLTPILADMFPLAELPYAFGILLSAQGAGLLIGPPLLGLLPGYDLTFHASGFILIASALSLILFHLIHRFCC